MGLLGGGLGYGIGGQSTNGEKALLVEIRQTIKTIEKEVGELRTVQSVMAEKLRLTMSVVTMDLEKLKNSNDELEKQVIHLQAMCVKKSRETP